MPKDELDRAEAALSDTDVQGHDNPSEGDEQDLAITATGGTCNG